MAWGEQPEPQKKQRPSSVRGEEEEQEPSQVQQHGQDGTKMENLTRLNTPPTIEKFQT